MDSSEVGFSIDTIHYVGIGSAHLIDQIFVTQAASRVGANCTTKKDIHKSECNIVALDGVFTACP